MGSTGTKLEEGEMLSPLVWKKRRPRRPGELERKGAVKRRPKTKKFEKNEVVGSTGGNH